MSRTRIASTHIALIVALVSAALAVAACSAPKTSSVLPGVEVRQYKGQRLDSVNDFRENSIKGPQHVDVATYRMKVDGLVSDPATYTYEGVMSGETTYTKVVQLDCVEGWSVKLLWEGVLLSDIIDRSHPAPGAVTVVCHGVDGYTTSLPLDFIRSHKILLAYKMNGVRIPDERGFPFMVVAEDHWGYKWAKWVTEIELNGDPIYRGFWEQRGYSQGGLLSNPFFGQ